MTLIAVKMLMIATGGSFGMDCVVDLTLHRSHTEKAYEGIG